MAWESSSSEGESRCSSSPKVLLRVSGCRAREVASLEAGSRTRATIRATTKSSSRLAWVSMSRSRCRRRKVFLEGPIVRALVTLAIPIVLGNVLQAGYQLTDAFWVGRLGASAVAAVSVSFPVTFLVIALGSGLAMAGATLAAQYMGAGRQDMVDHVTAQTMVMVAITSAVLGALGYGLSPYLLTLLGVASDVYAGALGFMRVSFVGIIFVFMYAMFQALMRAIGQTRLPLYIVFGTVVLNFILDPLFIFGWGPTPGLGVMGAALATLVTQALAALIGMGIFLRGRHGIRLRWRALVRFEKRSPW